MDKAAESSFLQMASSFGSFHLGIPSIATNTSSDSDMAQYAGKRRAKTSEKSKKTLTLADFNVFHQCFDNSAVNVDAYFADLAKLTKDMLPTMGGGVRNETFSSRNDDDMENAHEMSVEIGEEDILQHDYKLERV